MGRRTGTPATRGIVGGSAANRIGGVIESSQTQGGAPALQRAVVVDVIMDPNILTNEQIQGIKEIVNNPRWADVMPVNSIVARVVSNEGGRAARTNTILFPFFSSHLQLPIQAGELVEIIYEDFSYGGQQVGYWMSRTSSMRTVEDVNYTHQDRILLPANNPGNFTSEERQHRNRDQPNPGFPNGGNSPATFALPQSGSTDNAYDQILLNATSYKGGDADAIPLQTFEPVPRWRKRPQELVLQGSNNTLICLGEDRKGDVLGVRAEENPDASGQAGSIDIVVGRGRLPPEPNSDPADVFEGNTAPWVIGNTRNANETDKTRYLRVPGTSRLEDNLVEGDPDLVRDAARIYVTMQSEVDVNYGLTEIEYTEGTLPNGDNHNEIVQPRAGEAGTLNKSYIVQKADHLRLIARKDNDNEIEGTILLLREGETSTSDDPSEGDLSYVYISKEGIHVEGPKVVLGRGLAELAAAASDPTPGGEPYIRWSKYRDQVDRMQKEINDLKNALQTQHDNTVAALKDITQAIDTAFAAATAVPYSPVLSLQTVGSAQTLHRLAQILERHNSPLGGGNSSDSGGSNEVVNTAKDEIGDLVEASKSTKIFGE